MVHVGKYTMDAFFRYLAFARLAKKHIATIKPFGPVLSWKLVRTGIHLMLDARFESENQLICLPCQSLPHHSNKVDPFLLFGLNTLWASLRIMDRPTEVVVPSTLPQN